ncbi:aldehyde ferredoxin oxidoreductase [Candidatus Bathyarchaeota archaeon]|nr:MAG: aldehyde ferredoxin oxidoreductase [Candidatus Bathyarchaeota archaeon]
MRGYAGKFLEVDLSDETIKEIKFSDETLRDYIGGRGLAAKVLWDRFGDHWEEVDPLGPENLLTVFTGPMTGYFPGGRLSISGKSPQSNGIVGSTIGSEVSIELRTAGYDGIIFSGRAEKPVYLWVTDDGAEIKDASDLWGKGAIEFIKHINRLGREELEKKHPRKREWKEPQSVYIGPAGESISRMAAGVGKYTHGAGYGGYGAVMGSKNLKAVVAKGTGPLPEVADPPRVYELIQEVCDLCFDADMMRRWGTGYLGHDVGFRLSAEPIKNWQEEWHDERSFGVDKFEERVWVKRYWGEFGCPTTCLKVSTPKVGKYIGAITDNPDYELQAYLGTNLGIFTPEENVYLSALIDDLGLCGIQGGNVMGFAGELYQRGILTKEELGFELAWGDADAFAKLIDLIVERKGVGDILAEGAYRAALKLGEMKGMDLTKYAITSKGIGLGAHGIRSGEDYPVNVSYCCSVQGGDHTSVAYLPIDHENSELTVVLHDSGVYCSFNTYPDGAKDTLWDFFTAVRGWKMDRDEWYATDARRIIDIQRAALLIGGPDLTWKPYVDDVNPERFYEPLPTGPWKGKFPDPKVVDDEVKEYYRQIGWDERGIPTSKELRRLGLDSVDKKLDEIR